MTGIELIFILLIVYWLFGPWVLAMVDVLSTRAQALYSPWERGPKTESRLSPFILKQVAKKKKEKELHRAEHKQDNTRVKNESLVTSKENEWLGFPKRQIPHLNVTPCSSCNANNQEKWKSRNSSSKEQDVTNILNYDEMSSPNVFVRAFSCLVKHYNMRLYPFATICDTVLTDDRVQDAIAETTSDILSEEPEGEHTDEKYRQIFLTQTRKAKAIVTDMHAAMSNFVLKLTSYILFKLFPRFLTSVSVHPTQIDMLRNAVKTNLPIIYVPLHRSHLDYITLIFTLLNSSIRPPLTAAGINLKIPVFGFILRRLGAFYIKRRIEPSSGSKDIIYRSTLHTYMSQVLKAGHNIKFYIEGGRTRTGKPCSPKVGLLSIIVDAYIDGTIQDALLVPVSVNYDKLVDGNFIRELLGQSKEKETFSAAISAIWYTLNSNYGSARIDFNQPYSLKELVTTFQRRENHPEIPRTLIYPTNADGVRTVESMPSSASLSSLHGTDVVREDHRLLVEYIANHLVNDCAAACAIMSTNVLSFLLLNKYRSGVKLGVLVETFEQLRDDLATSHRDVGFSGESIDVVNSAIRLLGPGLVKVDRPENASEWDQVITPATMLPNVIELSYYGNALLPHFALKAIVATSIISLTKQQSEKIKVIKDVRINEDDLIQHSLDLCELLQFEFVLIKPCQNLGDVIHGVINDIRAQGILSSNQVPTKWNSDYDESDGEIDVPPTSYNLSNDSKDLDTLSLYNMTLRPLIDTYVVTALSLHRIIGKQVTESDFTKEVLEELQTQLDTGYCLYGESCSSDSIKNACKVLKKWGVLEAYTRDTIKLIYLTDNFNSQDSIQQLTDRVSAFKWFKMS